MTSLKPAGEALVSLIFPRRCPICDRPVRPYGAFACDDCADGVGFVHGATCYKCGKPLTDEAMEYCEDCARTRHVFNRGISLFEYRSVSDSIYRFKYRGRREYAAWYGRVMAQKLGGKLLSLHPDALVPVPIHSSKMRSRGYNQSALIARELSDRINIPVWEDAVRRIKRTTPLKDLTPSERNIILRGAFKLGVNDVKLKTIVIIDDIYTTGATVDAVADVFLRNGARDVFFATLATGKGV